MKNAIILAAGRSQRFTPFTYEMPKGLFCVNGEILIERQIKQLQEAGIKDIYVVIGFMKEKFFYLEERFGVKLIICNSYLEKNNLFSVYSAKEYLKNTYLCCSDHYYTENPFFINSDISFRLCEYKKDARKEFCVKQNMDGDITQVLTNEKSGLAMVGYAYFTESFSKRFIMLIEKELNTFGINKMFWEEFFGRYVVDLHMKAKKVRKGLVREFDSIDDLCEFDHNFLVNIDSSIIRNICDVLSCQPNDVKDIEIINKGLTNISFKFRVEGTQYVYRHPGGTSNSLVDRSSEVTVQYLAKDMGIDKSVIHIDNLGWKLSYYISDIVPFDLQNECHLKMAIESLNKLHAAKTDNVKTFDTFSEAMKLMDIAMATKGDLKTEFKELIRKVEQLNCYIEMDNFPKCICHNDTYAPNFMVTKNNEFYLIDWEYTGINDPANDLACILCRSNFTDEDIDKYIEVYLGRKPSNLEYRHYIAYIALSGFYWFCWGLYKGSVNDDDGFFMLPAYKNCRRFIDSSLESYQEKESL